MKQGLSNYEIEPFEPLMVREGDPNPADKSGGDPNPADKPGGNPNSADKPGGNPNSADKPGGDGSRKTALGGGDPGGPPEKYELQVPENVKFEGEEREQFEAFAKDLGLSQEQAQKLFERDLAVRKGIEERVNAEADAAIKGWLEAARADKEFGGEKFDENVAVARRALEAFGTAELKDMLNTTGLGNHPEAIRFMYRVGKAISEDKLVLGDRRQEPKRFYTASDHNV